MSLLLLGSTEPLCGQTILNNNAKFKTVDNVMWIQQAFDDSKWVILQTTCN
ncbi:MAG TPA: hypothetical protein VN451_11500 [Chitinophagaceae bacterium]|nr:hypothetical protein [Chitinophagaceae bacterium]